MGVFVFRLVSLLLVVLPCFLEASLLPPALRRLPLGASKPRGWLRAELELQAKGLTGQLPWFWHYINKSAWLGSSGSPNAQFVPYYLNGLVPLSYLVDDANLVDIRERYLHYILGHQDANGGFLGPALVHNTTHDAENYWGKYPAVEAFAAYAEADPQQRERVLDALVRHHRQVYNHLKRNSPALVLGKWAFDRSSDAMVGIQWLMDQGRTEPFLEDLMHLIRTSSDDIMKTHANFSWEEWFESGNPFAPWNDTEWTGAQHFLRHGVDIGQAMKTGAVYWRASGNDRDWRSPSIALAWADRYLHMSDGMYIADEEVPRSGNTPSRGTETCSVVETMFSMRITYEITGNISFMDRLERIAFNSLPAALWPDVTANVYHHCSNQLAAGPGGPFEYNLFFCCSANVHQGWPKFAMGPVHVAADGSVVVSSYAPTVTTLSCGSTLEVHGQYPFSDNFTISSFLFRPLMLKLRVPCWADGAAIRLNEGELQPARACDFFELQVPSGQSIIAVELQQDIKIFRWHDGAAEVHRGPLTFALRPRTHIIETLIHGTLKKRSVKATSPWNFALNLSAPMRLEHRHLPTLPFSARAPAAVSIFAQGRRVHDWKAGKGHGPDPPPPSPVFSSAQAEEVELVPFGATNVRISVFPVLASAGHETTFV